MKKCNNCGTMLEDEALFCSECGAKQEPAEKKCHNCGAVAPRAKVDIIFGGKICGKLAVRFAVKWR